MTLINGAEWCAVALNLAFTIGLLFERRWSWLPGFVASVIGVWLYGLQHTWALMVLNVYYAAMAVYGWWHWGRNGGQLPVMQRALPFHLLLMGGCALVTIALALLLRDQFDGRYPQLDAYITVFSLAATWMMARKIIENWLYWMVGDAVAVYLNWRIGYEAYALLNVAYIILSITAFVRWGRSLRRAA